MTTSSLSLSDTGWSFTDVSEARERCEALRVEVGAHVAEGDRSWGVISVASHALPSALLRLSRRVSRSPPLGTGGPPIDDSTI